MAPVREVTDEYFGQKVVDPYRCRRFLPTRLPLRALSALTKTEIVSNDTAEILTANGNLIRGCSTSTATRFHFFPKYFHEVQLLVPDLFSTSFSETRKS